MLYTLKFFDKPLLTFSFQKTALQGLSIDKFNIHVENLEFLPLDLKLNKESLLKWLERRTIPSNRAFVQSLLAKLGLNQKDTKEIIKLCKGLSLNDCYWVTEADSNDTFTKYNLYDNRFDRTLSLIAYTGYGDTQKTGFKSTPELTTGGMLAKCWRRIKGDIYLFKAGTTGAINTGNEPYAEFYTSQIAQKMELKAVEYNLRQWKGKHHLVDKQLFSTCQLFTNKNYAFLPAGRLVNLRTGNDWQSVLEFYQELGENFYSTLLDMLIFDAVICNEDRHFGNFGLLIDNQTNTIYDTAPLFDHGMSLFNYAMDDDLVDINAYAKTRLMRTGQDFVEFSSVIITTKQKNKLKKLINFKFKKHPRYNWADKRLRAIESFIQVRVQELLNLPI